MGTQNDPSVNSSVRVLRVSLQAGSLCYFAAAPALSRIPNSIGRGEAKAGAIAYAGGKRSRAKAGAFAYDGKKWLYEPSEWGYQWKDINDN
jgi:hypothetical protein